MPIGGEQAAVQNPFLRYATEAGWIHLTPDEGLELRRGLTSPVLDTVLIEQLQKLNPGIVDRPRAEEIVGKIVRVRPTIEGNLDAWEFLKGLKTVFVEAENRERNLRLLNPTKLEANSFHVTSEFKFTNGTPPDIRTDLHFFINGVPVLIVETKSAKRRDGIAQAFDDIRYYHRHGPELLAITQVFSLTHLLQFYYGATWNLSRKGLMNWRDEQAGDFEALCKSFIDLRRLLRVLTEFILFIRKDGELTKAVLRPHQMRAVERCLSRAKDPQKRRGLIWHTQGSGKTYTMITVAKRLVEDPAFNNPTVLMIVDRNELESQLSGNLESLGWKAGPANEPGVTVPIAQTKKDLIQLLRSDRRGIVLSMIHKFDDIPANVNLRENIYVLVDEAHRSTGGDLGNYLMGALPDATYLGFTGTPIDRTAHGKGTFKVFGSDDPGTGYLDKYSIRESVIDGTTVPLHYSLAPNELQVDRETLEKEFLGLTELEGVSDIEELNKVLERAVTLKNMMKNPDRMVKVARFIAEHFKSAIEPMGYKAFVVAVDREACALYKQILDKYLPPEWSQVVISSGGKKDPDILKKYHLDEEEEKAVRKAFSKPIKELTASKDVQKYKDLRILIVTEKLLTGFDAPILYCMYLDKPMRDHVLLQAIARVNRPYEDDDGRRKPAGFVLDFVGIFANLEKALAFDSKDVEAVVEGIDILKVRFANMISEARQKHLPITAGKNGDKAVEALLEHFRDKDVREEFYTFYEDLEEVYEILSPDAFLRPFLDDYSQLTEMYQVVRSNYDRGVSLDKEFLRKTARLVQEHTQSGTIQPPGKVHKLTAETLAEIAKTDQPDAVKVFNLLKAIQQMVQEKAQQQPYLINIGDKAEEIAQAFEDRQKTTQDTLTELDKIVQELRKAQKERDDSDLSPEAFAVFWYLQKEGVAAAKEVAKQVMASFGDYPHWQSSSHQEQALRRALYKALIDGGVEKVVECAQNVMKMLKRATE
jgi:type I restriction enzyme R subunit